MQREQNAMPKANLHPFMLETNYHKETSFQLPDATYLKESVNLQN